MRLARDLAAAFQRHRRFAAPIAAFLLIAFAVFLTWLSAGRSDDDSRGVAGIAASAPTATATVRATPTLAPATATPTQTPSPFEAAAVTPGAGAAGEGPAGSSNMRMVIPKIGVDAPVTVRVMGSDGAMGAPNGRFDVVWYDFSAWPGMGGFPGSSGNAVFSGHVDYHPSFTAVFWDLRQLAPGDIIEVHLGDGRVARYSVTSTESIPSGSDFSPYALDTGEGTITIVTCQGTFNSATRSYDQRLVVRGALLP